MMSKASKRRKAKINRSEQPPIDFGEFAHTFSSLVGMSEHKPAGLMNWRKRKKLSRNAFADADWSIDDLDCLPPETVSFALLYGPK